MQAAPGQWPGPSRGTNSPLDCSCPSSALSDERVQLNAAGQVELKLKAPRRDGTTHLVMSPLECMQRLAALVPRPRLHLIRFGARLNFAARSERTPLREHGCRHRTRSCGLWWCRRGPTWKSRPPKSQLPASAKCSLSSHGRTAWVGAGCSGGS
ncbi:MAG: transposase [Ideonella sp.]|nr:transposase [Ideonella sp.]